MLTTEEVIHIAELARLQLTEVETEKFRGQLSEVLDYVNLISELDLTDVDPTHSVITKHSALRKDEVHDSLTQDQLLKYAPETDSGCFRVPAILDET